MIEAFTARSGAPSLKVDGIALHSPYDPVREAERFVESSLAGESPSTVIVLGEGLGYAAAAVKRKYPEAKIIHVHYSTEIFRAGGALEGSWHPGQGRNLADFLRSGLDELDSEGLRVLEWPPSAQLFPAVSRIANEAVRQVVRELNGSLVTTIAMGKLWLRNSIANFLSLEPVLSGTPCAPDRAVLIAASGPSLERSLPLLSELRERFDLWALASSVPPLRAAGLEPDLVVMTDPRYYSIHHLHFTALCCPVALPLSAARGLCRLHRTLSSARLAGAFLLSQPEFFEQALLAAADIHAPLVAPHGTVAATALDLALVSTQGPVVFAGLDLCTEDLLSHARPNAFDLLQRCGATLLSPHHSQSFHRALNQNPQQLNGGNAARSGDRTRFFAPTPLRTYAGWLAGCSPADSTRIFRLFPSPVALPSMRALDSDSLRSLARTAMRATGDPTLSVNNAYPPLERRRAIAERLLDTWHRALLNGRAAIESTSSLSFHRSPTLHSLLYYLEPQLLLEAKRKLRKGEEAAARASIVRACECGAAFLRIFAAKVFRDC